MKLVLVLIVGLLIGWFFRQSQEEWCDKFYREYKPWLIKYGSFEIFAVKNGSGDVVGYSASMPIKS